MGKIKKYATVVAVGAVFAAIGSQMAENKKERVAVFNPAIVNSADQIAQNPAAEIDLRGYTAIKVTLPKQGITKPDALIADTYNQTGLIGRSPDGHIGAAVACTALSANVKHWPAEGLSAYQEGLNLPATSPEASIKFKSAETACLGALAVDIAIVTPAQPHTFTVINGMASIG